MDVPEKRRLEIKKIITENESISVSNLSKLFNVSEITVRRDLQKLEKDGFLDKVHGGAIARSFKTEYDPVYLEDIKLNKDKKESIAKEAVKEINDGDAVIIESGTTCLELVYNLANKRNLAIFTASVPIAYELWKVSLNRNDLEVNICGGLIEAKSNTLIGSQATQFFQNINADVAFIGAVAISIDKGILTTHSQMDADVIRSIANNSKRKILLADSSKFKKRAHISILPLTVFSKIITDSGIDKDIADKIRNLGIELKIV
jgi:DeoR/GlpR family transcriptional regulator of sugar metabolism